MKQSRPFVPTVDKLCTILDVDKPGDLPKAVQELIEDLHRHWLEKTKLREKLKDKEK